LSFRAHQGTCFLPFCLPTAPHSTTQKINLPPHPQKQPKIRVSSPPHLANPPKPPSPLPISISPTWHSYPHRSTTMELSTESETASTFTNVRSTPFRAVSSLDRLFYP
jgi:hypothetical protein